ADAERSVGLGGDGLEVGPQPLEDPEVALVLLILRWAGRLEEQLVRRLVVERRGDVELAPLVLEEVAGPALPRVLRRQVEAQAVLDVRPLVLEVGRVLPLRGEVIDLVHLRRARLLPTWVEEPLGQR